MTICRLCLGYAERVVSITHKDSTEFSVANALSIVLPIVKQDIPNNAFLCYNCCQLLKLSYKFINKSLETECKIKGYLKAKKCIPETMDLLHVIFWDQHRNELENGQSIGHLKLEINELNINKDTDIEKPLELPVIVPEVAPEDPLKIDGSIMKPVAVNRVVQQLTRLKKRKYSKSENASSRPRLIKPKEITPGFSSNNQQKLMPDKELTQQAEKNEIKIELAEVDNLNSGDLGTHQNAEEKKCYIETGSQISSNLKQILPNLQSNISCKPEQNVNLEEITIKYEPLDVDELTTEAINQTQSSSHVEEGANQGSIFQNIINSLPEIGEEFDQPEYIHINNISYEDITRIVYKEDSTSGASKKKSPRKISKKSNLIKKYNSVKVKKIVPKNEGNIPSGVETITSKVTPNTCVLRANFTGKGDYINDHDYFASPYARHHLVRNIDDRNLCICLLCNKAYDSFKHIWHMRQHETICDVCKVDFHNVFVLNLHVRSHYLFCSTCKTRIPYKEYTRHSHVVTDKAIVCEDNKESFNKIQTLSTNSPEDNKEDIKDVNIRRSQRLANSEPIVEPKCYRVAPKRRKKMDVPPQNQTEDDPSVSDEMKKESEKSISGIAPDQGLIIQQCVTLNKTFAEVIEALKLAKRYKLPAKPLIYRLYVKLKHRQLKEQIKNKTNI